MPANLSPLRKFFNRRRRMVGEFLYTGRHFRLPNPHLVMKQDAILITFRVLSIIQVKQGH